MDDDALDGHLDRIERRQRLQLPLGFGLVQRRLHIDDVCAVFPVHGSAGVLGALLLPFFTVGTDGGWVVSTDLVVPQVVGVLTIAVWTVAATALVFGVLKAIGQPRVHPRTRTRRLRHRRTRRRDVPRVRPR